MTNRLTLREIAQAVLDKHAVSGRQLDAIARKRGLALSYTTVNAMASGSYASRPGRATLDALAALSDGEFTREQVYTAAGRPVPLRPFADDLPDGVDALRPGQRNAVLAVVRQFVQDNERQEKADGTSITGPTKHRRVRTRTRRPTSAGPDEQSPDDTPRDPQ